MDVSISKILNVASFALNTFCKKELNANGINLMSLNSGIVMSINGGIGDIAVAYTPPTQTAQTQQPQQPQQPVNNALNLLLQAAQINAQANAAQAAANAQSSTNNQNP